jgi:hypothetical protein
VKAPQWRPVCVVITEFVFLFFFLKMAALIYVMRWFLTSSKMKLLRKKWGVLNSACDGEDKSRVSISSYHMRGKDPNGGGGGVAAQKILFSPMDGGSVLLFYLGSVLLLLLVVMVIVRG